MEETRTNPPRSLSNGLGDALRIIIASSSFLLPSNLPFKDIITEGLFAISQFMNLINNTTNQLQSLTDIVRTLSRSLKCLEIFLELTASHFLEYKEKSLLILVLESLKGIFRLIFLYSQENFIMIESWDQEGNIPNDIQLYQSHYLQAYSRKLRAVSSSFYFSNYNVSMPSINTRNTFFPSAIDRGETAFTGRRSGLKVAYNQSLQNALHLKAAHHHSSNSSSPVTSAASERSTDADDHSIIKSRFLLADYQLIPDRDASVTPLKSLSANLSDFNTPYRDPFPGSPITSQNQMNNDDRSSITASQLLLVGETLYILRPVIYALLLWSASHQKTAQQEKNSKNVIDYINYFDERTFALLISFLAEMISISISENALEKARQSAKSAALLSLPDTLNNYNIPAAEQEAVGQELRNTFLRESKQSSFLYFEGSKHSYDKELQRRKFALFLYLIRSPLFDRATLSALKMSIKVFQNIPLISSLPQHLQEILIYANKIHFYNSNS